MKKLLTATTALALVGGAAFAELTMSGSAEFALDYNSNPDAGKSKHAFNHQMDIDFAGSGTTDGGLSFGGSVGFNTGGDSADEGKVFVSGSFGKLTFGDNDSADKLAGGIADVGLNGIGVDDIAEQYGKTANQLRYEHTFGAVSIAISAGTSDGSAAVPAEAWTALDVDKRVHVFTADPTMRRAFVTTGAESDVFLSTWDKVFGIKSTSTAAGVLEGIKAGADTGVEIIKHGYATDKAGNALLATSGDGKGKKILVSDATKDYKLDTAGTGVIEDVAGGSAPTALASGAMDAFNAYHAVYMLGADGAVGADDTPRVAVTDAAGTPVAAAVSADNQYAFGMSFNAGGVTVGVGHDSLENTSVGLGFSTGDISTNALYVKMDGGNSMGADVSYAMGASTLTLAYSRLSPDTGESRTGMGLGVVHDLGGGANLNAGFGQVDDEMGNSNNMASIGMSFAF